MATGIFGFNSQLAPYKFWESAFIHVCVPAFSNDLPELRHRIKEGTSQGIYTSLVDGSVGKIGNLIDV